MKKLWLLLLLLPVMAKGQIITTFAGNGSPGYSGDGGQATTAEIQWSCGLSFDNAGDMYIVGGNRVRKINTSGMIITVAGNGTPGYSGDGGPAVDAMLNIPGFSVINKVGELFIADFNNNRIRKVSLDGIITTIAGTGTNGFSGDGGPATAAMLGQTSGITLDTSGNLYFCDNGNRVRKISTSGIISTVAGNGAYGYSGDGGPATAAMMHGLEGITADVAGNLYVADRDNYVIRKIATSGIISTVAGDGYLGYTGDGGPATKATLDPMDVRADKFGNIYISDHSATDAVRLVNSSGFIYTIAATGVPGYSGDGGPATAAELHYAYGIALDACDNLYITDADNYRVRKVTFPDCDYELVPNVSTGHTLSIYPNPATEEINVDNVKSRTEYALLNITGTIEQQGILRQGNNTISTQLLPSGVYLLELVDDEGNKTVKKFIRQ